MALNKVEICGVNTARLPLLKNEEKEALFERIKEGDLEARELYIKGNLRLVLSVIRRFGSSSENADDLFQIGCIGLMKAIDHFDPTLNVKFSTYAVPMIIGEIRRYLRDNNSIRVSRSLRDTAYKAIYARDGYVKKNLKEPTIMEIAEEIGIPKEEIDRIFVDGEEGERFQIAVVSFGFKHGIPADVDLVFDVRFLPNPYYDLNLRPLTGNDKPIQDFVMKHEESVEFLDKLDDMMRFLIPNYIKEGKYNLVIGIGCTGGKHRSVTITNKLAERLKQLPYSVKVEHRDIMR